jgi:hydroxypyruvate isomerase
MAMQIIKRPDGLYAIWSTVVDAIVVDEATAEEVEEEIGEQAKEQAVRGVKAIIEKLNRGERPYCQFTKTYEEALMESEAR